MLSFLARMRNHKSYPYLIRLMLLGLLVLLSMRIIILWRDLAPGAPGTVDFSAYWSAGQLLKRGVNPYDFDQLLTVEVGRRFSSPLALRMWNPPWLLLWLFPLFLLGFPTAVLVWLGVNLVIILLTSSLAWITFDTAPTRPKLIVAWMAGVAFVPGLMTLRQGQVRTLVLLGVVGFLFFIEREQDFWAGAALALTTIKPHTVYLLWIVVLWWVVTQERWRALIGTLAVLAVSSLVLTGIWPEWIADYRMALESPPPLLGDADHRWSSARDCRDSRPLDAVLGAGCDRTTVDRLFVALSTRHRVGARHRSCAFALGSNNCLRMDL